MNRNLFIQTNSQKIVSFLSQHPGKSFFDKEIAQKTGLSRGGTNEVLRCLSQENFVTLSKKGRMCFYSVNSSDPVIKCYKVLNNVLELEPLIEKIKSLVTKIILFGSSAQGTNTEESDIDLFILTNKPKKVMKIIIDSSLSGRLQPIIKTSTEYAIMQKKESIFCEEIDRGIILFERHHHES